MDIFDDEYFDKLPNEKCVYYHKNNTRIFTSAYEGIPENLLLNFIGWLILLILFAILRKRAGNYGRIALVQKSEKEEWMQLFYGSVDNSCETNGDTRPKRIRTRSNSSLDSRIYFDTGFFSWVKTVFTYKDKDIKDRCGQDAVHYLVFQRYIIFYMSVVTFIALVAVLPINFQGNLEGDGKTFGHTTVSNLSPSSPFLWAHVILAVLYLPLGIVVMRKFSKSIELAQMGPHVSRTLMITNIPRRASDKNDLLRHFGEAYPEIEVNEIQLAFDITTMVKLDEKREKASQGKLYCDKYFSRTQKHLQMRPYICGNSCCCYCSMLGCPKVDAGEYYAEEETRLSSELEDEKAKSLQRPLGVAFVTLVSTDAAQRIYEDHTQSCKCSTNPSSSSLSRELEPYNWRVTFAPDPQDIYWENLSVPSKYWYIKAILVNLCLFIVLFFLTTPAIVVNTLDSIKFSDELQKMNPVLSEFLPTLLLWTVAALMPVLVSYSDRWLSHWTRSEHNHAVMLKCFIFLLFMLLILPSLGLASVQAFTEFVLHPKNESYRYECIFLPDKGAFFVNYVITSAFIGTGLELIRFPELFMYAVYLCLARSQAEKASVRKAVVWEFAFGVQYAWMLLIFAMTVTYSLSCPLITPFGLLYMVLKHLVDKYNLCFVYAPSKINQSIHETAIYCVIASLVILQFSFMALSLVRRGLHDITIFSLTFLLFTLACFFALMFLNWCKGFNPITYTKKPKESEEEETRDVCRAPTASANLFVPAVLQPSPTHYVSRSAPQTSYGTPTSPTFDTSSLPNTSTLNSQFSYQNPIDTNTENHLLYQNHDGRNELV